MANNYLITGYWGEPHVTAENDRGLNAATFGTGRFVLPVGNQFRAEYIGNNTIRIYDGKLMNNGAAGGIPAGEYVDVLISNAGQGKNRNDIIAFQYEQDASTLVERGTFVAVQGAETSGTASDPALTQEDLLAGDASFDQMALWRIPVSGATIAAPVKLFSVAKSIADLGSGGEITPESIGAERSKLAFYNVSVGTSVWVEDTTYRKYPFRAAVTLSGVTSAMTADVVFGVDDATSGNFAPVNETYGGGVYVYAAAIPEATITIPRITVWR